MADYQKALNAAHAEVQEILKKRSELDQRLEQLKATINALSTLLNVTPQMVSPTASLRLAEQINPAIFYGAAGISDAIRQLLADSKVPMSAVEIKAALAEKGFDMDAYNSPLVVIHNTINRLDKQGELVTVKNPAGQVVGFSLNTASQQRQRERADRIARIRALRERD
jgi:hypothetical protein